MKRLIPFILVSMGVVSCAHFDESLVKSEDTVSIAAKIGPESRVSEDGESFLDGDAVMVENKSRTSENLAEFTYDSETGLWNTEDILYWQGSDDNSFTAWYPVGASYERFVIPASQTGGTADCDWMTTDVVAKKENGAVMLSFEHHLSKITVVIESWNDQFAESERTIGNLKLLSLSSVMQNDGHMVVGDGKSQFVDTYVLSADSRFSAIVSPGTYSAGTEIINITIGEKQLTVKTIDAVTINPANAYTFFLTVGKDEISVSGVSVGDWAVEDLGSVEMEDAVLELEAGAETDYDVPFGGGTVSIPLKANVEYEVSVDYAQSGEEWIQTLDTRAGSAQTSLTLSILPNKGTTSRSAVLSITNTAIGKAIDLTFRQGTFTGLDDSSFATGLYMTYVENEYEEGSGTAFDYDLYSYCSHITNPCASAVDWEFKFKLASEPSTYEECYIMGEYVGRDNTEEICLRGSGLYNTAGNDFTWAEMGVNPTDVITMKFKGTDLIVNGTTLALSDRPSVEYIFSSYYYDRDDGVCKVYYGFQEDARMYYVKGWDSAGRLVYLGGPSMEMNSGTLEACWVANYYDSASGTVMTKKTFSYKGGTDKDPFGYGNLLGDDMVWENSVDLSRSETANCYIVSKPSSYKFTPVKGNSSTSVGTISSAEVLWESYGTSEVPEVGSLIRNVSYSGGYIHFETPKSFKEGNAVIAAKDADGNILWSWHIWLTDKPADHTYANNAGVLMDRNLGATSTTPGDVTALGLHYQWGRKDPFVGTASITSYAPVATTTDTWSYTKDLNNYTIEYAIANPTVKINYHYSNYDWLYTGSDECDNTRWQSQKTIYDPCPQGYRVTEGTEKDRQNGVWPKAFNTTHPSLAADDVNKGFIIGAPYCSDEAWYPAPGYWGDLGSDTFYTWQTYYWTVTPFNEPSQKYVKSMLYLIPGDDFINSAGYDYRSPAGAFLIRCQKI